MSKKKEFLRTVKYALIAASAGMIQFGSFALLNEVFKLNYWLSYLIALVLSVIWNFTLNRRYTFKSANNVPKAMLLVLAYYVVFTPLSTCLEAYLTDGILMGVQRFNGCGWNEYLVTIINMVINGVTEFLFQRFVVFGKSIDTNSIAQKDKSQNETDNQNGNEEIK